MKLHKVTPSIDGTSVRHDLVNEKGYIEVTEIYNKDPPLRRIFCVPSSYGCALGCTFCHLTKAGSSSNNPITPQEFDSIIEIVDTKKDLPLLISLMGAGEPLLNLKLVEHVANKYNMALATSLPSERSIEDFMVFVKNNETLPIKVYVSIHTFVEEKRKSIMPGSVSNSTFWLERLVRQLPPLTNTNGHKSRDTDRVVVHYTIIPGVNDSVDDLIAMLQYLKTSVTPPKIKFLAWSDGDNSKIVNSWMGILKTLGFKTTYHCPNGNDVGGACGQFNPQYYS